MLESCLGNSDAAGTAASVAGAAGAAAGAASAGDGPCFRAGSVVRVSECLEWTAPSMG